MHRVPLVPAFRVRLYLVSNSGVILVADDEPVVLRLAEAVLNRGGYRVLVAENGMQALEVFNGSPRVDLVLTDVVMPLATGPQLVHSIHETSPNVRCIFMSGYTAEQIRQHGADPDCSYLRKPFTPNMLLETVQRALAA